MNGHCLDIGTIQAFLDGETRPEAAVKISGHVADCDNCALLLTQAEEENSMVFSVLDREMNALVPTQRLWSRINETIAEEKIRTSVWQRFMAFVTTSLANPSFAAAAAIILVVGMIAGVWNMQWGANPDSGIVAGNNSQVNTPPSSEPEIVTITSTNPDIPSGSPRKVTESTYSDDQIKRMVRTAEYTVSGPKPVRSIPASTAPQFLPGEESYIKTINELEQGVTVQSASLSASSQVSFQRDMAVVDDSIVKMREVVRKNPRNQSARQVLYSSYQDKIDLLKSSAQSDDLMASLQ